MQFKSPAQFSKVKFCSDFVETHCLKVLQKCCDLKLLLCLVPVESHRGAAEACG